MAKSASQNAFAAGDGHAFLERGPENAFAGSPPVLVTHRCRPRFSSPGSALPGVHVGLKMDGTCERSGQMPITESFGP